MNAKEFCLAVEKCRGPLRAFTRSLCRQGNGADDLVQETLMRAWAAQHQFVDGTNFKAWLFTIARNKFLDGLRRNRETAVDVDVLLADPRLSTPPPQDDALHFADVTKALLRLGPHHREILTLVGANGVSYQDAARLIGCAVGTVRSRLSRARIELRGLLNSKSGASISVQAAPKGGAKFKAAAIAVQSVRPKHDRQLIIHPA